MKRAATTGVTDRGVAAATVGELGAVRLCRAGRKRNLEHPDLRSGHGTGDPPDHQARARQYVRGASLGTTALWKPVNGHGGLLSAENDVGGMLGRLMFGDAVAE